MGGLKGYLRIDRGQVNWYCDKKDTDEARIEAELKQVYVLATVNGVIKEESAEFQTLGLDAAGQDPRSGACPQPVWTETTTSQGLPYLVRSGLIADEVDR